MSRFDWNLAEPDPRASILPVLELVAAEAGVEPLELVRRGRSNARVVRARAVAMYLAREITDCSLHEIGRAFRRDHTTVLAAHRRVARGPHRAIAREVAATAGIVLP